MNEWKIQNFFSFKPSTKRAQVLPRKPYTIKDYIATFDQLCAELAPFPLPPFPLISYASTLPRNIQNKTRPRIAKKILY